MEYFVISAKFVPLKILYTLIATAASNLVFSWVFGSANSVTRPDRRNTKMVYRIEFFKISCKKSFAVFFIFLNFFSSGQEIQRISVIRNLPELLQDNNSEGMRRVVPKVRVSLLNSNLFILFSFTFHFFSLPFPSLPFPSLPSSLFPFPFSLPLFPFSLPLFPLLPFSFPFLFYLFFSFFFFSFSFFFLFLFHFILSNYYYFFFGKVH